MLSQPTSDTLLRSRLRTGPSAVRRHVTKLNAVLRIRAHALLSHRRLDELNYASAAEQLAQESAPDLPRLPLHP